jgi:hypothetical protein
LAKRISAAARGFFFFTECETNLGSAVLRVVVSWSQDTGYADILDEIFGEGNVARIGGYVFSSKWKREMSVMM